jgi:hypothetical protein
MMPVLRRLIVPALGTALLFMTSGPAAPSTARAAAKPAASAPAAAAASDCGRLPRLERGDFPERPRVDNRFSPLRPGGHSILDGFVIGDDGLHHPHRIETTVTDLTKVIDGVRTLVVYDADFEDGLLTESELFFEAQDRKGAVWLLGEYPEQYDGGRLSGAPSTWITGVAGASAGIAMPARPRVGDPTYLQGLARAVGFEDCVTTFQAGQRTCVPVTCYDRVLVTDEFGPLDPASGHQRKFYAPGVGTVRVTAAGGVDPETLVLIRSERLCEQPLASIRDQALQQDGRGYTVVPGTYAGTPHAKRSLDAEGCSGAS